MIAQILFRCLCFYVCGGHIFYRYSIPAIYRRGNFTPEILFFLHLITLQPDFINFLRALRASRVGSLSLPYLCSPLNSPHATLNFISYSFFLYNSLTIRAVVLCIHWCMDNLQGDKCVEWQSVFWICILTPIDWCSFHPFSVNRKTLSEFKCREELPVTITNNYILSSSQE